MSLAGKTLFISGASRGIGLAIALRAARDGARIAVVAKTDQPHPKLEGTVHTARAAIEAAGGEGLAVICDVRNETAVRAAVEATVARFGGIDICINNASAISLTPTLETAVRRYDLMSQVNARATFLCSKLTLPWLLQAENPHILNISPPLEMNPRWFAPHLAYTMAKFGMEPLHARHGGGVPGADRGELALAVHHDRYGCSSESAGRRAARPHEP